MEFNPQDQVVIAEPQINNTSSVLLQGEVVSIEGNSASVLLQGEDVPRTVPVNCLSHLDDTFGDMTGRPNEMPVLDQIRR